MIVVDTSVWIAGLRPAGSPEAITLASLLDADEVALPAPVRSELLAGASPKDRIALKRALSALPVVMPTDDTWQMIDIWTEKTAKAGQRFGIADLVIAALAREAGALIWSLDSDFERLEKLKLIDRYDP